MKHNVLGVPRLSIFRAAPIAKWQQAAGLPKNAFTSNGITALGLLPFHQKCGRALGVEGEAMQAQMKEYGSVMQSAMDTAKGFAQSAAEAVKDATQTVADAATHAKDRVTGAATDAKGKGTRK